MSTHTYFLLRAQKINSNLSQTASYFKKKKKSLGCLKTKHYEIEFVPNVGTKQLAERPKVKKHCLRLVDADMHKFRVVHIFACVECVCVMIY